jgi:NAD-dependent deacetylase
MTDSIVRAAELLSCARYVVALTGAGISVESGIPPFRGKGGLWEKIDPIKYASIDSFLADPADIWEVLIKGMQKVLIKAKPNRAHLGLARLETLGILKTIITQNVDRLHQSAGSKDVIEFHGSFATYSCLDCHKKISHCDLDMRRLPPKCTCGGIFRPEVIFFGEQIPMEALKRSEAVSHACDVMLVIGSSATVQPAAFMPIIAKETGATIIEINAEPTELTRRVSDIPIIGKAGAIMDAIVDQVEKQLN